MFKIRRLKKYRKYARAVLFTFFIAGMQYSGAYVAHAFTIDELRQEIENRTQEVFKLGEEIGRYQEEIERTNAQAQTLQGVIKTLELTDKKLNTDILLTDKEVGRTKLVIDALGFEINDTGSQIKKSNIVLGETIRKIHELESRSLVEIILADGSFSTFWSEVERLGQFQENVGIRLDALQTLKVNLEVKKKESEKEKTNLQVLRNRYADQKLIVAQNKNQKAELLNQTKNKEANYKTLLEDRLAKKEALEREIDEFESRLKQEIDPGSLPETGTGILSWPLDRVFITQYFGNTPFASKNPQVYNGGGHNGVDFRASVGTLVRVAASGVVTDTGDTDQSCYKVSYGKWVLVRHGNGISTLYAHLSLISVYPGQEVERGDVVGYSGRTGYSTGPHLHFGVFANQAVQVTNEYKSRICGTYLKLPLSPKEGYLNPLSYLPALSQ